jgi:hypothetical protein
MSKKMDENDKKIVDGLRAGAVLADMFAVKMQKLAEAARFLADEYEKRFKK